MSDTEAVERAARALYAQYARRASVVPWDRLGQWAQDQWRSDARAVLAAAAPTVEQMAEVLAPYLFGTGRSAANAAEEVAALWGAR